jgi:hypothetical protein
MNNLHDTPHEENDDSQHKPAHTGVFFDDQSRPVQAVQPWPEPTPETSLLDTIKELPGVIIPDTTVSAIMDAVEDYRDGIACTAGADGMAVIYEALPKTKGNLEMHLALSGKPVTEADAKKLKRKRQTIAVNVSRIRKRLRALAISRERQRAVKF